MSEIKTNVLTGGCSCGCCKAPVRKDVDLLDDTLLTQNMSLSAAKSIMQAMQTKLREFADKAEQSKQPTEAEKLSQELYSSLTADPGSIRFKQGMDAVTEFLRCRLLEERIEPKDGPWGVFFEGYGLHGCLIQVNGVPIYHTDFTGNVDPRQIIWERLLCALARRKIPQIPPKRKWRLTFDPHKEYVMVTRITDKRVFHVLDYEYHLHTGFRNVDGTWPEEPFLKLGNLKDAPHFEPFWDKACNFIRTMPMVEEVPNG